MFVIAVPSVSRRVLKPRPRQHASESLFASVMNTPSKPASSACLVHSTIVGSGLSGIVENARAIFAILIIPYPCGLRVWYLVEADHAIGMRQKFALCGIGLAFWSRFGE